MVIDYSTNCLTIHVFMSPAIRLIALCIVIGWIGRKNLCIDLVKSSKTICFKLSVASFEEAKAFRSIKCWPAEHSIKQAQVQWQWLNTIFMLFSYRQFHQLASISVFYLIRRRRQQSSCSQCCVCCWCCCFPVSFSSSFWQKKGQYYDSRW